ncbi:angio-associated migratory cell protein-like [Ruditapes philippinarum]|uniref:angio-associated migratory cell protein-like n=1 Tax=Ruditapes philippinarum TaxID=129788 RepID=UPI00295BD451|nr:angio-associated migratory cell protein-like [Ruditapes philippinarum]
MSEQDNDNLEDLDDVISPDDVVEIIELDDNGVVVDAMDDVVIIDDDDDDNGDVDMGASGGEDIKDMADIVFDKHTDAVFCVSIDPKSCDLVVTGGQDDKAYVWKLSTGEVLFECIGHKDSVTCTGFSHDGVYVATADISGLVIVWKIDSKEVVFTFECSDAEWMKWHPASHVLFLGTVDGDVWMWKIPSGDCKTLQSHGRTASCGVVLGDGKRMCVGYDDGSVKLWDLKSGTIQHSVTGNSAHKSTVLSVDVNPLNNLIISGSTDVTAKIINGATAKVLATFDCSSPGVEENSVETVGFSPTHAFAATGTVAGVLSIWDTNTQICRHRCPHNAGIVSLQWDKLSPMVYTSCLDGAIRLWNARSGELTSTWTGHRDSILGFDISKDGNWLVTASDDNTARVFSLSSPDR